jgi:hypothetical protein
LTFEKLVRFAFVVGSENVGKDGNRRERLGGRCVMQNFDGKLGIGVELCFGVKLL